ncbi:kelch-like protein 20 [Paramacrobiotus metropolitanus]|uniref:kelch-like protein 20 n=1 Tax=Paramacrobiotus metropolitanus TaxID=2943436 RepID=UPI0024465B3E|nr:kelch-like protein 20 [Paramacrobiotus metropolitanus]
MVKDGQLRIFVLADVDGQDSCRLHAYDVGADRWAEMGMFPVRDAWLTTIDDRIYLLGGDREVYAFDKEVRHLTAKAKMPLALFDSAMVACRGLLFVFGGANWVSSSKTYRISAGAYCYDPARNVWKNLAPMPTARSKCRACVGLDGLIYVVGGCGGNLDEAGKRVDAYNIQTNQWQSKGVKSTGRAKMGLVRLEDKLYAVAGSVATCGGVLATERYDPEANRWEPCEPAFPLQCDMHCAVVPRSIAWKNMQRSNPDDRG